MRIQQRYVFSVFLKTDGESKMMDIGRLCLKIAGRDSGKKCVIIDTVDKSFVMIDGETRRRKCNLKHLEPLAQTLNIKKGAAHKDIVSEFKKLGMELVETKPRPHKEKPKQKRVADAKVSEPKEEKAAKPAAKDAPEKKAKAKAVKETKLEKAAAE